jgi:dTDP-4-amino-4,6-dideoxygalactose transaminase
MSALDPVVLGGPPILTEAVPLARPPLVADAGLLGTFGAILAGGVLTKGEQLAALERELAEFLGVGHAVVVASCTTGLMLVLRTLGRTGEVVMPGFTFMATAHAARWSGLTPVFADIDPQTFNLAPPSAGDAIGERTAAILGVHIFGTPCDADGLAKVAAERGVPFFIDAAPAFGAEYGDGTRVGGKGVAEVFSLSPTKTFTTGEGGIIATADGDLARELRIAREYGNPGDFDSLFAGLNGRMPELSAALGRHLLPGLPALIARRQELAARYREALADVPGVGFQLVPSGAGSTYKDHCLVIDGEKFGTDRDVLAYSLRAENVPTRNYFDPPVHRQTAYRDVATGPLPHSEALAASVIAVPLYSGMPDVVVDQICAAIRRIHHRAGEVGRVVRAERPARDPRKEGDRG